MQGFRTFRGIVAAVVVTALLLPGGISNGTPGAQAAVVAAAPDLRAQVIYFQQNANLARRDLALGSITASSAWQGQLWNDFIADWTSVNKQLKINTSVPGGLPAKGHVFVLLGAGLTASGKISTKLERRLAVTLSALKAYPNSHVLVSGGKPKNGKSEAQVMADWLVGKGIAKARILTEAGSSSTVSNATNSMEILANLSAYSSYSLISDASHLRRATILFAAATVRVQEKSGKAWPIKRVGNVAYPDEVGAGQNPLPTWSVSYIASNVASVFGLSADYQKLVATPPSLPVLTSIEVVDSDTLTYSVGDPASSQSPSVRASYDNGALTREVASEVKVTGIDTSKVGKRFATVTYSEGKVTKSATFAYEVVKASSKLSLSLSSKTVKTAKTKVLATVKVSTKAPGITPTGEVKFYLDGKKLYTSTLPADGVVKFKYPKIKKKGKHLIQVKYTGDSRLNSTKKVVEVQVKS